MHTVINSAESAHPKPENRVVALVARVGPLQLLHRCLVVLWQMRKVTSVKYETAYVCRISPRIRANHEDHPGGKLVRPRPDQPYRFRRAW